MAITSKERNIALTEEKNSKKNNVCIAKYKGSFGPKKCQGLSEN